MEIPETKLIKLKTDFVIPDEKHQIIITNSFKLKDKKEKISLNILKGSVAYLIEFGSDNLVVLDEFEIGIENLSSDYYAISEPLCETMCYDTMYYENGYTKYKLYQKNYWTGNFAYSNNTRMDIDMGKEWYILNNIDCKFQTPETLKERFFLLLKYFEKMEYYEACDYLLCSAFDWFIFYHKHYEENPELKYNESWGWLYQMNYSEEMANNESIKEELILKQEEEIKNLL